MRSEPLRTYQRPHAPGWLLVLPEALYRLSLYTRPGLVFRLGDRVEVTDESGRIWHGRTSDSFPYPSHCVTVVEVSHVEPPRGTQQSGSSGGQVSRETGIVAGEGSA